MENRKVRELNGDEKSSFMTNYFSFSLIEMCIKNTEWVPGMSWVKFIVMAAGLNKEETYLE